MLRFILTIFILLPLLSFSQEIYQWNDFLPYRSVKKIIHTPSLEFALTDYSVYSFDKEMESVERLNKINYLSDIGISDAAYSFDFQSLVVGYTNGNIDVIQNSKTINFQDIIRANQITNKTLNQVNIQDSIAYVSGGFGIVLFDLKKLEIQESYQIGPPSNPIEVNAITFRDDTIFAATNKGVYWANKTNPLVKFPQAWSQTINFNKQGKDIKSIFNHDNKVYINYALTTFLGDTVYEISTNFSKRVNQLIGNNNYNFSSKGDSLVVATNFNVTVYDRDFNSLVTYFDYQTSEAPQPRYGSFDEDGIMWIGDLNQGLVKAKDPFNNEVIIPSSPKYLGNRDIISIGNKTRVTRGERESNWGKTFTAAGLMVYENGDWKTISKENISALDSVRDIINLSYNPTNISQWAGASLGFGVLEFDNENLKTMYTEDNSSLIAVAGYGIGVSDLKYDNNGNLWATNMLVNQPLHVKTPEGNWKAFNFGSTFNEAIPGNMLINGFNHKWVIIQGDGILVFDENNTIEDETDDRYKLLTNSENNGNLPSSNVLCIAEDKDGEIWIGTDLGLRVIYSPERVFENSGFDAQDILIKQGLYFQILLESEAITCITVDGGDNKWIGTQGSGVYLLSPEGQEELFHFTAENSPLWSNSIQAIEINPNTGEVFIGTNKGLIAFKGTETEPNPDYSSIYAYPNPVPINYTSPIAIKGLVRNSEVKITDLAGNIILKTIASGGQVTWNLNSLNGNRVTPGVYLVCVSTLDGTQREVTKILVQ